MEPMERFLTQQPPTHGREDSYTGVCCQGPDSEREVSAPPAGLERQTQHIFQLHFTWRKYFNDFSPTVVQGSPFLSRNTQTLSFQMSPWRENKPLALVSSRREEKKKKINLFHQKIRFNPYTFPFQVSFWLVYLLSKIQETCPPNPAKYHQ